MAGKAPDYRYMVSGPAPGTVFAVFNVPFSFGDKSNPDSLLQYYLDDNNQLQYGSVGKKDIRLFTRPALPDEYAVLKNVLTKREIVDKLRDLDVDIDDSGEFGYGGDWWKNATFEEKLRMAIKILFEDKDNGK